MILMAALALALTQLSETEILQEIDDHCADTWCESNTDYEFKAIQCNSRHQSCLLTVNIIPWGIACGKELCQKFEHQCRIDSQIFYESLGDCLNQKSEQLEQQTPTPC